MKLEPMKNSHVHPRRFTYSSSKLAGESVRPTYVRGATEDTFSKQNFFLMSSMSIETVGPPRKP